MYAPLLLIVLLVYPNSAHPGSIVVVNDIQEKLESPTSKEDSTFDSSSNELQDSSTSQPEIPLESNQRIQQKDPNVVGAYDVNNLERATEGAHVDQRNSERVSNTSESIETSNGRFFLPDKCPNANDAGKKVYFWSYIADEVAHKRKESVGKIRPNRPVSHSLYKCKNKKGVADKPWHYKYPDGKKNPDT